MQVAFWKVVPENPYKEWEENQGTKSQQHLLCFIEPPTPRTALPLGSLGDAVDLALQNNAN